MKTIALLFAAVLLPASVCAQPDRSSGGRRGGGPMAA